jgi:hypothetical protein
MIAGKMRQPVLNASNEYLVEYLNGSRKTIANICDPKWVHVEDVAQAHIEAALRPEAAGKR